MEVPSLIGLFLLSVAQTLAQLTAVDLGSGQPLYSGPASQFQTSPYQGQSPYMMSPTSRYQQPMMMSDPRMSGQPMMMSDPRMSGQPMMMSDPRMSGQPMMMSDPRMSGQPMMMSDPRMSGQPMMMSDPRMSGQPMMMSDPRMSGQPMMMSDPRMSGQPMMMSDPRMSGQPMMMSDPRMSGQPMMMSDPRMSGMGMGPGPLQNGFAIRNPGMYGSGPQQFGGGYPMRGMPLSMQGPLGQASSYGAQMGPDPYGANELGGPMGGPMGGSMMGGPGGYSPMGMQSYPGSLNDGSIITAGNGMGGGYPMGGPGGVSFFPFARVRPGPGLVIISTKESGDDDTESQNEFGSSNSTDTVSNTTLIASPVLVLNGTSSAIRSQANNATLSTSTAAPAVTTTQTPCTHPVYMNRVFMSTALSMGLISANTSCVVLVDH